MKSGLIICKRIFFKIIWICT